MVSFVRRAGNLGRADPARGATASGLRLWLARAVAMTCLASLVPALFISLNQLPYLHPMWLVLVGGSIVGFSLLMPVYAWQLGDIRWLSGAYALAILVGLLMLVMAWRGQAWTAWASAPAWPGMTHDALFLRINRIVSREMLLMEVWKLPASATTRSIDTYISRLRRKAGLNGESGWTLGSVYQLGYRLTRSTGVANLDP